MRVLLTCVVGVGHFNPMVPLARAFQASGHDLAFATDPGFVGHIRGVGFEAFPAGLDMVEARRQFITATPGFDSVAPWDSQRLIHPGLFATVRVPPMLDDLGRIIPDWRPDLLIHDAVEFAGAIAAELAGIPHAEHSFGVIRPLELRRLSTQTLAPVAEGLGVPNPGVGGLNGELYLDICPPGLQLAEIADVPRVQPLQPVGFDDSPDATSPSELSPLSDRPLVYVTMGTEYNKRPEVFQAILDGLAGEPIHVVVTVGPSGDPDALRPWPANVQIERFIPQSRLLRHSAAFVSHGGSGATLGAIRAGVPMLAIPQGADQFVNAERVAETGMGLRLLPSEVSASAVRDAVRALLDDQRFADSVAVHRVSMDAMPPPEQVVPILERLVRAGH